MAFEKFNKDMKIISALDDEPNDVGGLTAAELKAKFDEGGEAIKRYINDTLIPAVVADGATEAAREQAETERRASELLRRHHEEQRVQAETGRQNSEHARVIAEQTRQSAENARNVWENYDASKAYVVGNKVAYGGSSYRCIKPCTGIAPPSAEYWLLIAKKGEPGGGGQPVMRIDLTSDENTSLDSRKLYVGEAIPSASIAKDTFYKIRDAVRAGSAYVTVMLKWEAKDGVMEFPITLQMFGTSFKLMDDSSGDDHFVLTGTYTFLFSSYQVKFMCSIDPGTNETVWFVKYLIPWVGNKPIYDPVDKPDETPDGAFLRWSSEKKAWVAETVPAAEEATF